MSDFLIRYCLDLRGFHLTNPSYYAAINVIWLITMRDLCNLSFCSGPVATTCNFLSPVLKYNTAYRYGPLSREENGYELERKSLRWLGYDKMRSKPWQWKRYEGSWSPYGCKTRIIRLFALTTRSIDLNSKS